MLQYGFTVETHNKGQQLYMEKSWEAFEEEISELGLRGRVQCINVAAWSGVLWIREEKEK